MDRHVPARERECLMVDVLFVLNADGKLDHVKVDAAALENIGVLPPPNEARLILKAGATFGWRKLLHVATAPDVPSEPVTALLDPRYFDGGTRVSEIFDMDADALGVMDRKLPEDVRKLSGHMLPISREQWEDEAPLRHPSFMEDHPAGEAPWRLELRCPHGFDRIVDVVRGPDGTTGRAQLPPICDHADGAAETTRNWRAVRDDTGDVVGHWTDTNRNPATWSPRVPIVGDWHVELSVAGQWVRVPDSLTP